MLLMASHPNASHDGWEATLESEDAASHPMTVYAVCSPDIGPAVFVHKDETLAPGDFGNLVAKCPRGTKVISGGGAFAGFLGDTFPVTKHGRVVGWKTRVDNASTDSNPMSTDVVCLDPTP
jgi:hypothetical protein